jgi:hypothetical protein
MGEEVLLLHGDQRDALHLVQFLEAVAEPVGYGGQSLLWQEAFHPQPEQGLFLRFKILLDLRVAPVLALPILEDGRDPRTQAVTAAGQEEHVLDDGVSAIAFSPADGLRHGNPHPARIPKFENPRPLDDQNRPATGIISMDEAVGQRLPDGFMDGGLILAFVPFQAKGNLEVGGELIVYLPVEIIEIPGP